MSISDKTRKMLWARSGNRCAICKIELVEKATTGIENIIVGQECHIVSSKTSGPRGNQSITDGHDDYKNLILLCANDHTRVDAQADIYTVDKLKDIKSLHESWVQDTLNKDILAFTNDSLNIKSLLKITSGKQIVDLVQGAHLYNFDHEELNTEEEAEIIGSLFQELRDFGDVYSDIGFSEITKFSIQLNNNIGKLKTLGFLLFGLKRIVHLRSDQMQFGEMVSSTLYAVRNNNPGIVGDFLIVRFPKKFRMV